MLEELKRAIKQVKKTQLVVKHEPIKNVWNELQQRMQHTYESRQRKRTFAPKNKKNELMSQKIEKIDRDNESGRKQYKMPPPTDSIIPWFQADFSEYTF